jgi:hypothetical protein
MTLVARLRDLDSDETEEYELVYAADTDVAYNRTSVPAPVGTAILSCRVGDVIEWPVPAGLRRPGWRRCSTSRRGPAFRTTERGRARETGHLLRALLESPGRSSIDYLPQQCA